MRTLSYTTVAVVPMARCLRLGAVSTGRRPRWFFEGYLPTLVPCVVGTRLIDGSLSMLASFLVDWRRMKEAGFAAVTCVSAREVHC